MSSFGESLYVKNINPNSTDFVRFGGSVYICDFANRATIPKVNSNFHVFPASGYIPDIRFYNLPTSVDDLTYVVDGTTFNLQGGQLYKDASNVVKILP